MPKTLRHSLTALGITTITLACLITVLWLHTRSWLIEHSQIPRAGAVVTPFPVGVDPVAERIVEQPSISVVYRETLAYTPDHTNESWLDSMTAELLTQSWYQPLASPVSRVFVIWPGQRKEEIVKHVGDIVRWNQDERAEFARLVETAPPILRDGTFYPSYYTIHRDATPSEVATLVNERFAAAILERYTPTVAESVPLRDALTIASLLEREGRDFADMRRVAGVIWNRQFIDMPLQLDATLQYVRGSDPYEPSWWPVPRPADKFLDSPYNTYQHAGLPPAPISNPSAAAVLAALNPVPTDCLFYFHGPDQTYYCSETYAEHKAKIDAVY